MKNKIIVKKPQSILSIIDKEFFFEYLKEGHSDYINSGNYYEIYYAISNYYNPSSILEIGVRYGYSLMSMIEGSNNIKDVVGYDIDEYESDGLLLAENNINKYKSKNINLVLKNINSQSIDKLDREYDIIHIDGCHSYIGKLHDLELCVNKCKVLIIDDYNHINDVKRASDDFIEKYKTHIKDYDIIDSFRGTLIIEFK